MMRKKNELLFAMIAYDAGDAKRIQHFLKVYQFAKLIGETENLDPETQQTLETAAIVHDIGIKKAIETSGSGAGPYQEELGPDEARAMLQKLGYSEAVIERVCYLVGHHHTYTKIDGIDYQILVEADFLVNLFENGTDMDGCRNVMEKIFKTETGKKLLMEMFLGH